MLKFITEQYLREIYKKTPFEIFKLEKEQRLTPGGRQFLVDKRIKVENKEEKEEIKKVKEPKKEQVKFNKNINIIKVEEKINLKKSKYVYKIKSFESQLFSLVSENLEKNMPLAQKLLEVARSFRSLNKKNSLKEEKIENIMLEDVEIHDIYIHNKNAVGIFKLHSILYEMSFLEEEILESEIDDDMKIFLQNLKYVKSKIFNIVVELLGGEQCQKNK
ncbi:hypothetical protein [uncultured Fusobacterium sp.]|jgi:ethanolamine utilization cobalamin adenosyltransferase|uniref:hypothetical protein n=1 Tax=uncultured Fusobacterium sp. TaxID=159267 RepID=UPI0025FDB27B|nr:hypothetical protein [uncultured Fusobacterium sp.]MCF2638526.1 hypothetical protein [Fusobacterium varium]